MKNNPQCILWLIKVFLINTAIQLLINVKYVILWFKAFLGFDFFRKFMLVWFFFDTDIHNSEIRGKKLSVDDYFEEISNQRKTTNTYAHHFFVIKIPCFFGWMLQVTGILPWCVQTLITNRDERLILIAKNM